MGKAETLATIWEIPANIEFTIDSMQVDNMDVTESAAGQSIGVKVSDRVRRGDRVYKVAD